MWGISNPYLRVGINYYIHCEYLRNTGQRAIIYKPYLHEKNTTPFESDIFYFNFWFCHENKGLHSHRVSRDQRYNYHGTIDRLKR